MERNHLKKYENDSSSKLATMDDFNALTNIVNALAQSLTNYVYEMGEHDEDAYDSRGEIFEEDVDYIARGEDCHYIPMLEDEIVNYYNPPPLQNQQGRVRFYADAKHSSLNQHYNDPTQSINQYQGVDQYFGNASSNLNFYSRQDDEEQEEPSIAQLMAQMIAAQAQQGKDIQLLMSELQQERAARKMLETQFSQHASSSSQNPEKFPLQPDDEQLEQGKKKEVEETPYVAPPAFVPPMPFPQQQIKVHVETIGGDKVIDVCQLTFFESKVLSNKHAKNSDTVGNNLKEVVKKSFHEGPEILICNTRLKDEPAKSLPGH